MAFCRARSCLRFIAASERWRPPSPPASAWFTSACRSGAFVAVALARRGSSSRSLLALASAGTAGFAGFRCALSASSAAGVGAAARRRALSRSCASRLRRSSSSALAFSGLLALALLALLRLGSRRGDARAPRRAGALPPRAASPPRPRGPWRRIAPSSGAPVSASEIPAGRFFGSPPRGVAAPSAGLRSRGLRHDHALALGLDHDVLRASVAEALLHRARPRCRRERRVSSCRHSRSSGLLYLSGGHRRRCITRTPESRTASSTEQVRESCLRRAPHVSHVPDRRTNPIHPQSGCRRTNLARPGGGASTCPSPTRPPPAAGSGTGPCRASPSPSRTRRRRRLPCAPSRAVDHPLRQGRLDIRRPGSREPPPAASRRARTAASPPPSPAPRARPPPTYPRPGSFPATSGTTASSGPTTNRISPRFG